MIEIFLDLQMIKKFQEGDQGIMNIIDEASRQKLIVIACGILGGDIEWSKEVVQDTFLQCWNKRETFNNSKEITGFLITTLRNKCLDELKTNKNRKKREGIHAYWHKEEAGIPQTEDNYQIKLATIQEIRGVVNALPPRRKAVLKEYFYKDKSLDTIARELGISYKTAHSHLKLGIKQIQERLKKFKL